MSNGPYKWKAIFFKASFTRAIKKQISNTTQNGNYTVIILYFTQALLNKAANVHKILWANETKLWNVRAEILIWAYLTPLFKNVRSEIPTSA